MQKKELLHKLYSNQHLTGEEAETLMLLLTDGKLSDTEITAVLMFYKFNPISNEELGSFRDVLLGKCIKFHTTFETIDVCGTGGDEKDTFNISTLSAILIAACGYKVVKHGNNGVSSVSGSSNILEHFGYKFSNHQNILNEQLEKYNICFLHAPLFHPALKQAASVRKQLGTKTIFNLLGPLVNPSNISHQFIGVNSLETMRQYHYLLQKSNTNYMLAHSLDGYDEISLTGQFKLLGKYSEKIIHPEEINLPVATAMELNSGNSLSSAAAIFKNVLENTATAIQKTVVITNAALAIQLITKKYIEDCLEEARVALEEGKALDLFTNLIKNQYEYA